MVFSKCQTTIDVDNLGANNIASIRKKGKSKETQKNEQ